MKVTFEFDAIEDADDLKIHQNARKYYKAVYDVTLAIRDYYKYFEPSEDASDAERRVAIQSLLKQIEDSVEGMGYWEDF